MPKQTQNTCPPSTWWWVRDNIYCCVLLFTYILRTASGNCGSL
jgi:hypothetical protein